MQPLRLAVAQPVCRALDVAANAAAHAEAVRASGARVVVFPELSLTGYELDSPALDPTDLRLGPLVAACAEAGAIALAGAPVAAPDGRHIAVLAIDASGARVVYRKVHLGDAEAAAGFVPGDGPVVLSVDGWRLGLAVCKDTGVAAHAAATAALGIDVYVAGVCHKAADAALNADRARSTIAAHGGWAATASFAGRAGSGYDRAAGCSAIWGPDGRSLAAAGADPGEVVATLLGPLR